MALNYLIYFLKTIFLEINKNRITNFIIATNTFLIKDLKALGYKDNIKDITGFNFKEIPLTINQLNILKKSLSDNTSIKLKVAGTIVLNEFVITNTEIKFITLFIHGSNKLNIKKIIKLSSSERKDLYKGKTYRIKKIIGFINYFNEERTVLRMIRKDPVLLVIFLMLFHYYLIEMKDIIFDEKKKGNK